MKVSFWKRKLYHRLRTVISWYCDVKLTTWLLLLCKSCVYACRTQLSLCIYEEIILTFFFIYLFLNYKKNVRRNIHVINNRIIFIHFNSLSFLIFTAAFSTNFSYFIVPLPSNPNSSAILWYSASVLFGNNKGNAVSNSCNVILPSRFLFFLSIFI